MGSGDWTVMKGLALLVILCPFPSRPLTSELIVEAETLLAAMSAGARVSNGGENDPTSNVNKMAQMYLDNKVRTCFASASAEPCPLKASNRNLRGSTTRWPEAASPSGRRR